MIRQEIHKRVTGQLLAIKQDRSKEDTGMDFVTRMYVGVREWGKGQTMTEYALILSAVAVVVFIAYQTMGQDISTLAGKIDAQL